MLPAVVAELEDGSITPQPQDESLVTVSMLIAKEDGQIDWSQSADHIEQMTRAFDPWPGAFTSLREKILKIISASQANSANEGATPGLVSVRERRVFVTTNNGELELLELQPEGKRPMSARDFINGTPDLDGSVLGQ